MHCYVFLKLKEVGVIDWLNGLNARGGGGGSLPLEVVPDARESPSKKHTKQGFNGIYTKKTP